MPDNIEEIHLKKGQIIKITPDMIIADIIMAYPGTLPVFEKYGIHCIGCYASTFESIEEGAMVHGLDAMELCRLLNKEIRKKSDSKNKKKPSTKKK